MKLPVLKKRKVWHVGDLDGVRQKADSSNEGSGLSVSEHPEEWQEIARLGGTTYILAKENSRPGLFVDMLRLGARRAVLEAEAVADGLLVSAERWKCTWWDSEYEEERYSVYSTPEDARAECEESDGNVEQITLLVATKRLNAEWKSHFTGKLDDIMASDVALLLLLEGSGAYDGAWWNERMDVEALSAPRGVIFQSKLGEWKAAEVPS